MEEKRLFAGYAEAKVTPPMGINIRGYFSVRISEGILTDLYLRAAAFACGEQKAIFFTVEAVNIRDEAAAVIRRMVAERCGIPAENVFISCNHSHTAFLIYHPADEQNATAVFLRRLYQEFCDAAQFAFEDLKPASLKTIARDAPGICFKRRYRMKDGSITTNPPSDKTDEIAEPVGKTDDSVRLVRVIREGGKELLMVNFGMHADNIGGRKYCADFSGYMTDCLKGAFGGKVEVLFFNGCEGDSVTRSRIPGVGPQFPNYKKGTTMLAERAGRCLAGAVLGMYDDAKDAAADRIDSRCATIRIGKNPYDPADLPLAKTIVGIYERTKTSNSPEFDPYKAKMKVPEALRIIQNLDRPEFFEIPLTLIRLGEIVFVGLPGEPFQDIGVAIKAKSPFPHTVVTALTNGGSYYFPTREAFESTGYERSTSPFAWDCAERIEEAALEGLNELYSRKG